jgi:hypothetical protein
MEMTRSHVLLMLLRLIFYLLTYIMRSADDVRLLSPIDCLICVRMVLDAIIGYRLDVSRLRRVMKMMKLTSSSSRVRKKRRMRETQQK